MTLFLMISYFSEWVLCRISRKKVPACILKGILYYIYHSEVERFFGRREIQVVWSARFGSTCCGRVYYACVQCSGYYWCRRRLNQPRGNRPKPKARAPCRVSSSLRFYYPNKLWIQSGIPNKSDQAPTGHVTIPLIGNTRPMANIQKLPSWIAIQSQYTPPRIRSKISA